MMRNWDTHFLRMAYEVSSMATCDRKHVGAVIVDGNKRVVATGFNGSPRGLPHCDVIGHELVDIEGRMSCVRTLHAESNAIDYAGRTAVACRLYTTVIPCYDCAKRIINVGITEVIYDEYYESRSTHRVQAYFESAGIPLKQVKLGREATPQ